MKKIILSSVATFAMFSTLNADMLGGEVGFANWSPKLTGTIKGDNSGDTNINLENDFGYGTKKQIVFYGHTLIILYRFYQILNYKRQIIVMMHQKLHRLHLMENHIQVQ